MCVYMCVCACVCMRVCVCVYASTIERTKKNIRVTLYYRICTVYAYEKLKRKRKKILEMFKTCVLPFFEITRHLLSSFLFPFDRMVSVVSLSRCSFENDSIHVIFSFRVTFFFPYDSFSKSVFNRFSNRIAEDLVSREIYRNKFTVI